jgi:ABC-type phosphate transport system substrate-binding protein
MKSRIAALMLAILSWTGAARLEAQVVVIANPGVKASQVSKSDLRDVFTGSATSLKDGSHVSPALLKGGTANDAFLTAYIGKPDSAFRAEWRSLVFSGQASMPKTLDSDAAMVDYVAHTPGAIGYVSSGAPHDGVKVLAVR